jgi:hypothetical protein
MRSTICDDLRVLLRDDSSDRFVSLAISGYEFPGTLDDEYDRNWLMIDGRAKSDDFEWSFLEPILLTSEAMELAEWLGEVARGDALVPGSPSGSYHREALPTVEPNLVFELIEQNETSATIRVFLQLESSPPDLFTGDFPDRWGYFVELTMERSSFAMASSEWSAEIAKFPPR